MQYNRWCYYIHIINDIWMIEKKNTVEMIIILTIDSVRMLYRITTGLNTWNVFISLIKCCEKDLIFNKTEHKLSTYKPAKCYKTGPTKYWGKMPQSARQSEVVIIGMWYTCRQWGIVPEQDLQFDFPGIGSPGLPWDIVADSLVCCSEKHVGLCWVKTDIWLIFRPCICIINVYAVAGAWLQSWESFICHIAIICMAGESFAPTYSRFAIVIHGWTSSTCRTVGPVDMFNLEEPE